MIIGSFLGTCFLALCVFIFLQHPRHDRDWEMGQEKLPFFHIDGTRITVENFRDFTWYEDGTVDAKYRTSLFDLTQLTGVDVIISHFDDLEGMAHIFVSFTFREGENMVISVESRREKGEKFSPWLGLMRQFELIYVVGSERDVIGLRTHIRNERLYIYPTGASSDESKKLLLLLMQDVNAIQNAPVFYHTIFRNCTNVITRRVEQMSDISFPLTYKMFLPGYMDEVLYEMKIIPHDKPFDDIKNFYRVENDSIMPSDPAYSEKIRKNF